LIKPIAKLILALNGNIKSSQIAAGIAWGTFLGLIPAGNIFWIAIFLVSFFFRHNHGAKLFGMAIVKLLSPLIVLLVDAVGFEILNFDSLVPLFTTMYNMPFVPFTNFNNTLVMGGFVLGLITWLPVFFIAMALIPLYRKYIAVKIRESKIVKSIAKFPLLKLIEKSLTTDA
jgi:uncharacterized protein (TIGR03546 family)